MFVCGFKRFCLHVCLFLLRCLRMSLSLDPLYGGGVAACVRVVFGFCFCFCV